MESKLKENRGIAEDQVALIEELRAEILGLNAKLHTFQEQVSEQLSLLKQGPPAFKKVATGPFSCRGELREKVMAMFDEGYKGLEIATALNISPSTVSRIKHGDKKQNDEGLPVHSFYNKDGK